MNAMAMDNDPSITATEMDEKPLSSDRDCHNIDQY